ncbi:MAG: transposase [Clostridia bacterium]|nr:transposase [Clostridia bacterium]
MDQGFPKRKTIRLQEYDYSQNGAYFITICTEGRKCIFGSVGADSISARMIRRTFCEVVNQYKEIDCPIFVVMPNHFHAIITIERADMESAPTISTVIQEFKRYSTIEYTKMVKQGLVPVYEKRIWQRGFYDHVIRNQSDYDDAYRYIENNPLQWELDELYTN